MLSGLRVTDTGEGRMPIDLLPRLASLLRLPADKGGQGRERKLLSDKCAQTLGRNYSAYHGPDVDWKTTKRFPIERPCCSAGTGHWLWRFGPRADAGRCVMHQHPEHSRDWKSSQNPPKEDNDTSELDRAKEAEQMTFMPDAPPVRRGSLRAGWRWLR
jgi:hypothetical protein